jgi:hypothetical protein
MREKGREGRRGRGRERGREGEREHPIFYYRTKMQNSHVGWGTRAPNLSHRRACFQA